MISKKYFNPSNNWCCYCMTPELIENYDLAIADKENVWICHHRKEELYTSKELVEMGMYYNVSPNDLVFCRNEKEHRKYPHKGDKKFEEARKKMAESRKGKHLSEEHKKNISESSKGKKMSEEARKKMAESHKGKHLSEEARKKISYANKRRKHSEETKNKISEAKMGRPSPRKGKHLSDETKEKLSEAHRGKHWKLVDGKRVYY